MKLKELRTKSPQELTALVSEQRRQLAQLQVDSRTKKLSNVKQFAQIKRTIARALTLVREQQLQPASSADREESHE